MYSNIIFPPVQIETNHLLQIRRRPRSSVAAGQAPPVLRPSLFAAGTFRQDFPAALPPPETFFHKLSGWICPNYKQWNFV